MTKTGKATRAAAVSFALLVAAPCESAIPAWPDDFWQQVTNSISATRPAAVDATGSFAAFARSNVGTSALGASGNPFDSRILVECSSEPFLFSSMPQGMTIIVR